MEAFHHYKVYNGSRHVNCARATLGMGKKVCEDWANLLMNERVKISLGGEAGADTEQEFLDQTLTDNNFWVKINESQELKAGLGTVAYVPYASDVSIGADGGITGGGKIKINYLSAENIWPLSWENGVVSECAFVSMVGVPDALAGAGRNYLYEQRHVLENGAYVIYNDLFSENGGQIQPLDLGSVPRFKNIPARIETNSSKCQFVIDRLNIANNIDIGCPMGVSVFANAMDILRGVDLVYDSYNNEFVMGKKRIMVTEEAMHQAITGESTFDPNDLVFYALPGDMQDKRFIQPIDMTIRASEHESALQNRLNLLSAKCGFGENHYKFDQGSITTATQIISENSSMFRALKKHEIILEDVLINLVRIILTIGRDILRLPLNPDVEAAIDFDDSIIEDRQAELADMRNDVSSGLIKPELYIMRKYNVPEDKAREMMPEVERAADKEVMP